MIHGIADHVHERIMNMFKNGGIDFHVFADNEHTGELSTLPCRVANTPGETMENRSDGDHANLHYKFLQFEKQSFQSVLCVEDFAPTRGQDVLFLEHAPQSALTDRILDG